MPQVKIYCEHCDAKIDVSEFKPFAVLDCPACKQQIKVPMQLNKQWVLLDKLQENLFYVCYKAVRVGQEGLYMLRLLKPASGIMQDNWQQFYKQLEKFQQQMQLSVLAHEKFYVIHGEVFTARPWEEISLRGSLSKDKRSLEQLLKIQQQLMSVLLLCEKAGLLAVDTDVDDFFWRGKDELVLADIHFKHCLRSFIRKQDQLKSLYKTSRLLPNIDVVKESELPKQVAFNSGLLLAQIFNQAQPLFSRLVDEENLKKWQNPEAKLPFAMDEKIPEVLNCLILHLLSAPEAKGNFERINPLLAAGKDLKMVDLDILLIGDKKKLKKGKEENPKASLKLKGGDPSKILAGSRGSLVQGLL